MTTATQQYQTYQSNNYEIKTIRLSSPLLHIGSEVSSLNRFEYVRAGNRVYFPRQDALSQALYERGGRVLNDYIERVEKNESIYSFLKDTFGEDWEQAKTQAGQDIFSHSLPIWALDNDFSQVSDVRPMIRNGMGELYIPGSSIKGAIRTAIAYHLLKHQSQYRTPVPVSEIEQKIRDSLNTDDYRQSLKNKRNQGFYSNEAFMKALFEQFDLRYQDQDYQFRQGPNTDFMRAISVSDSATIMPKKVKFKSGKTANRNFTALSQIIISSYYKDGKAKYHDKALIFAEVIRHVSTTFTLSVDFEMLSWFFQEQGMQIPFKTVGELLKICQEFSTEQWAGEYDYWYDVKNNYSSGNSYNPKTLDFDIIREFYEPEDCPYHLRLGWGTGMNGVTINWLLQSKTRSDIRDACASRKECKAPGYEAPKSRRTAVNQQGEIAYPLGWVQFKVLS